MGPRSSKQQAETNTEDTISDLSFSVINIHMSSAASGAMTVISIARLALLGYFLA